MVKPPLHPPGGAVAISGPAGMVIDSGMARKPKLGSGKRFKAIAKAAGGGEKGRRIAAAAGRKKWGAKRMAKLSATGRRRAARRRRG